MKRQAMKKTITLTDDQIVAVGVAIETQIMELNKLLRFVREREGKEAASLYEKDIAELEQVKAVVKEAKWEFLHYSEPTSGRAGN